MWAYFSNLIYKLLSAWQSFRSWLLCSSLSPPPPWLLQRLVPLPLHPVPPSLAHDPASRKWRPRRQCCLNNWAPPSSSHSSVTVPVLRPPSTQQRPPSFLRCTSPAGHPRPIFLYWGFAQSFLSFKKKCVFFWLCPHKIVYLSLIFLFWQASTFFISLQSGSHTCQSVPPVSLMTPNARFVLCSVSRSGRHSCFPKLPSLLGSVTPHSPVTPQQLCTPGLHAALITLTCNYLYGPGSCLDHIFV